MRDSGPTDERDVDAAVGSSRAVPAVWTAGIALAVAIGGDALLLIGFWELDLAAPPSCDVFCAPPGQEVTVLVLLCLGVLAWMGALGFTVAAVVRRARPNWALVGAVVLVVAPVVAWQIAERVGS